MTFTTKKCRICSCSCLGIVKVTQELTRRLPSKNHRVSECSEKQSKNEVIIYYTSNVLNCNVIN